MLLTFENVVKVSDFGLSRTESDGTTTAAATGPLRWMPPEALTQRKYNVHTDAWMFGVVLWELFSGGLVRCVACVVQTTLA